GLVRIELIRDDALGQARLRVSDNGIGIASEDIPHIFNRFYRADKARVRDVVAHGSGLGLSICKAIVDAHGGTISLASTPGARTTFTVALPLVAAQGVVASEVINAAQG